MKMTRRNFLSTSAVAALACGASLTAHAAGSTDENSLNFITDIFKDSPQPGEIEDATAITAEKNAEWYEKLDFSDRRGRANIRPCRQFFTGWSVGLRISGFFVTFVCEIKTA